MAQQLKYGYTVGLSETGEIVFEFINEPGMIELMGLHEFAGKKIAEPFDEVYMKKMAQDTAKQVLSVILQALGKQHSDAGSK